MSWYKVEFTAQETAAGKHSTLQDGFEKVFLSLNAPVEMALFARVLNEKGNSEYYFSPACFVNSFMKALINSFNGQACEKPEKNENSQFSRMLVLIVGQHNAWKLFS